MGLHVGLLIDSDAVKPALKTFRIKVFVFLHVNQSTFFFFLPSCRDFNFFLEIVIFFVCFFCYPFQSQCLNDFKEF